MDDWQNETKCFEKRAQYILSSKLLTDCEFDIEKEKVKCHKLILAMGSPVFQAMFYGRNEEPSGSIEIKDIGSLVFKQIIEHIYGKSVNINSIKNACDLFYGARKYLLCFLENECIDYLKNNLTIDNVLYLHDFAKFHCVENLRKQCILEMQSKTEEVLDENNLYEISEDTLKAILEMNLLNVPSELTLFNAVEKWIVFNKQDKSWESQRQTFIDLVKKIRLLTLSIDEFIEGPAKSQFLSDAEKLAILLRIVKGVQIPMGNGLCELTKKRKKANFKCMSNLSFTDVKEARCDGSEWLTSIFTTKSHIELLGVEIKLQVSDVEAEYFENVMVKISEANSEDHFAEGSLCGVVPCNSKAQIMLNKVAILEPDQQYAVHVFLCQPGMYPIGTHSVQQNHNESNIIDFVSHSSWERAHPFNTTIISSLIYNDTSDDA